MEEQNLNVALIKQLLYKEISSYYNWLREKQKINNIVNTLENIIRLFEEKKYQELYDNYEEYDYLLADVSNISKNRRNDIYFYLHYLANTDEYDLKTSYYQEKHNSVLNNISSFYNQIVELKKQKIEELKNLQPPISEQKFNAYKYILFDIKENQFIGHNGYEYIKELLKDNNYTEKQIIILLENIRINNVFVGLNKKGARLKAGEAYKVLDAINFGYEEINLPYSEHINLNKVENMFETCKNLFVDYEFSNATMLLPEFDGIDSFTYGYSKDEFEYVMKKLLLYYQKQLVYYYNNLINLENYEDKELRGMLVNEYYKILKLYNNIRNYMDEELDCYNSVFQNVSDTSLENGKELYYSLRNSEEISTFFENDLKDIPFDLYYGIKELLIRFEKNTLSIPMSKSLHDAFPGLREIKNDQVRIMYRHLENNKYVIVGIFLKKRDLDLKPLERMARRPIDDIVSASEINSDLFQKMDEKSHFGGRKNA